MNAPAILYAATPENGAVFFAAVTERTGGFLVELATADVENLYAEEVPA